MKHILLLWLLVLVVTITANASISAGPSQRLNDPLPIGDSYPAEMTSITPNSVSTIGSIATVITGAHLLGTSQVKLSLSGQPDIIASNVNVVDDSHIQCDISAGNSVPGQWNLIITKSPSLVSTFSGAFEIRYIDCGFEPNEPNRWPWQTNGQSIQHKAILHDASVEIRLSHSAGYISYWVDEYNMAFLGDWSVSFSFSIDGISQVSHSFYCYYDWWSNGWVYGPGYYYDQIYVPAGTHTFSWYGTWYQNNFGYYAYSEIDNVTFPPNAIGISSISPSSASSKNPIAITDIAGGGFVPGTTVKFTKAGQADVSATNVVCVNSGKITCTAPMTGKALGLWDVVVTNPAGITTSLPGGFDLLESVSPVISTVTSNPQMVAAGDAVQVQVKTTDNVGVTRVTANGIDLTKTSADTWKGPITADTLLGTHTISVVSSDAAGNSATKTGSGYKTVRVLGISQKALTADIMTDVKSKYLFKLWGYVMPIDSSSFWLDDGSGIPVIVQASDYASKGITNGAYISARGQIYLGEPSYLFSDSSFLKLFMSPAP